jgi:hypothetical protein
MLLMFWISRPVAWNATFTTIIFPCLGFLFVPITTMVYVWLIQGVGGIHGIDWLWLFLAFLMDLGSIAATGAANRDRLPPGVPGSTAPPQPPANVSSSPPDQQPPTGTD